MITIEDYIRIKKETLWQATTLILGVLLVVSIFTDGFRFSGKNNLQVNPQIAVQPTAQPTPQPQPAPQPAPQNYQASIDDDPIRGSKDAKVVIVEFSDFQCPFCARFYEQTEPSIITEYVNTGKARFVYRDFPLSFHPNAAPAAEASECADEQGKYWEFHDKVFGNQDSMSVDNYKVWAKELGLDTTKFNTCVDQRTYKNEVEKDFNDGQAAGVSGTPAFIIGVIQSNGKTVVGQLVSGAQPFSSFKTVIDAALAKV